MPLQITPVRKWQLFTVVLLISNLLCAFAAFHFYRKVPEQFFQSKRPSITDRNGDILVFSMTDPDRKTISYRHSASPESAAALIGYVTHAPYNDSGLSGIEKMIDEKKLGRNVRTTLDSDIQEHLEELVQHISTNAAGLRYVHATVISSDGEMIATSQRPVMGILRKRSGLPESTVFLPSTRLIPVSEQMMSLLGCQPDVSAKEKEKYRFHIKQGFDGEARGFVLGLNRKKSADPSENTVQQAATSINYLLAYIAAREQTQIKQLKLLSLDRLCGIKAPVPAIVWKSVGMAENNAAINAIGEIPALKTDGEQVTLYVFLRAACAEHDAVMTAERQKEYEAVCRKVQTMLNNKK